MPILIFILLCYAFPHAASLMAGNFLLIIVVIPIVFIGVVLIGVLCSPIVALCKWLDDEIYKASVVGRVFCAATIILAPLFFAILIAR